MTGHGALAVWQPSAEAEDGELVPRAETGAGDGAKKRRMHVGQACMNCRRRKSKCDGQPPTCGTCRIHHDECAWDEAGDGRRNVSRAVVQGLRNRIKMLEAQLAAGPGHVPGSPSLGQSEGLGSSIKPSGDDGDDEVAVDLVVKTMLHLHVTDTGDEVQYYGPTSAYAHSTQTTQTHRPTSPALLPTQLPTTSDFRRYLPPWPRLSESQHRSILDCFFRFFASWNLRAHPLLFFADLSVALALPPETPLPRYSLYSPFLHNIILALALRWADDGYLCTDETRAVFAKQANVYMVAELARPVLATVQALAIKSSYHSTEGDHTTGWAYFGMSERLSQSLGLNVDCAPLVQQGVMSEDESLRRTATYWTIAIQEQTWAVYLGRPHVMQEYNTPTPAVDEELDRMPFPGPGGEEGQPSMLSIAFVETTKLAVIMQKVMTTLYSLTSDLVKLQRDDTISQLGLELDVWAEQLPDSLTDIGAPRKQRLPHLLMLQLAKEWMTILIYRPYYRPIASLSASAQVGGIKDALGNVAVKRCDAASSRITALLRAYASAYKIAHCPPTLFNITFTAGTTHLLAAARRYPGYNTTNETKAKDHALKMAQECVGCLRRISVSWAAAGQKADILEGLVRSCQQQEVDKPPGGSMPKGSAASTLPDAEVSTGHQSLDSRMEAAHPDAISSDAIWSAPTCGGSLPIVTPGPWILGADDLHAPSQHSPSHPLNNVNPFAYSLDWSPGMYTVQPVNTSHMAYHGVQAFVAPPTLDPNTATHSFTRGLAPFPFSTDFQSFSAFHIPTEPLPPRRIMEEGPTDSNVSASGAFSMYTTLRDEEANADGK